MKFVKRFKTETDYNSYIKSDRLILPNISLIDEVSEMSEEDSGVRFNSLEITPDNSVNGYEYVDLGLPSGTLWAKYNVGANNEYEVGDYFAWGEAETKSKYSWSTYKWGSSQNSLTKYNSSDKKITLDLEDDAATVNMGSPWRMPTYDELEELSKNLTAGQFITINNVVVREVESVLNGAKFYIPCGGIMIDSSAISSSTSGYIWGSQRFSITSSPAFLLSSKNFSSSPPSATKSATIRNDTPNGYNVRGVIKPNK